MKPVLHHADCLSWLQEQTSLQAHLTFLDPPFNQGHAYRHFNDSQDADQYWRWITAVLSALYNCTTAGGAIYFMQREKNSEFVLSALRAAGWQLQNLIIWKKMASAVPCSNRYGKQYQIIAYATRGKPRLFNRLRIDPPPAAHHKVTRDNGIYVTDVWDDIRELTSGYFAGNEPLRTDEGARFHKEQSPLALLVRIILSSTRPNDTVLDPFAGTGTTLAAARQLGRHAIGIEVDAVNVARAQHRIAHPPTADNLTKLRPYYRYTPNLNAIWQPSDSVVTPAQPPLAIVG